MKHKVILPSDLFGVAGRPNKKLDTRENHLLYLHTQL